MSKTTRGVVEKDNIIIEYNINNNYAKIEKEENEVIFDIENFDDLMDSLNKKKLQQEFFYKI